MGLFQYRIALRNGYHSMTRSPQARWDRTFLAVFATLILAGCAPSCAAATDLPLLGPESGQSDVSATSNQLLAQDEAVTAIAFESASADSDSLPPAIELNGVDARWQLQVTGQTFDFQVDLTRDVVFTVQPPIASINKLGFLTPIANGLATVSATYQGLTATIPIEVRGLDSTQTCNFPNQIVPIFTKFGCNGGGCHGKSAGQGGFKLSLLGFEPREDFDHLVNESRGRRLFPAVPERSLLLQKATNQVAHGGGERLSPDSPEYRLLRRWIQTGMPYGHDDDPTVVRIDVIPNSRRAPRLAHQQLAVFATYSDGHREDITHTAQYESNNPDLAEVDEHGMVSLRDQSGDVSVMARYQGQVSVFRASIPLGVDLSEQSEYAIQAWPQPANLVDQFVFEKLKSLGIPPSSLCDDATFIRRVTLDLTGRLPTIAETRDFVQSDAPQKLERLVDRLLDSKDYAEHFARKWVTILRNRRDNNGYQFGNFAFHDWICTSFQENKPYDAWVRELLTASGSIRHNPPVAWYREVTNAESRTEDAAQLFLGQRLQCARCHHHPYEKWSQTDYYQMLGFFSSVRRKSGTNPDEPIFVSRVGSAGAKHPKTGKFLKPAGLDATPAELAAEQDPRDELADWMTAPENPFFARSLVNRYWKHFFATGVVEPEDDMRVTNPPSNPELLDGLSQYFVQSDYNLKALTKLICTSTTYRLKSQANDYNLDDANSYSRFYPKRLQAEVLLDAVNQVTLSTTDFEGMPAETRAVSLPDTSYSSYFMDVFGEPDSSTACECERSGEATLAQSLHLLNSVEVQNKLTSDSGRAASFAASSTSVKDNVRELYLIALSREPSAEELATSVDYITEAGHRTSPNSPDQDSTDHPTSTERESLRKAYEDLVWAMINTKEFLFNH